MNRRSLQDDGMGAGRLVKITTQKITVSVILLVVFLCA